MASSDTEICNIALRKLREQPIASLTEATEAARQCNAIYAETRDFLISRHPHNFAMRRQSLSQLSATPDFQYDYQYALPTSPYCLRAWKVWHNGRFVDRVQPDGHAAWVIEGRNLLTDYDTDVLLMYLARVEDEVSFPPTFVEALATELAQRLSYAFTRDKNFSTDGLEKKAVKAWKQHTRADAMEGQQDRPVDGVFITGRE